MSKGADLVGLLDSEYEIVRELGHGGASVVYLGRDPELERDVAIKIIDDGHAADPEAQARFQREARMLAQLHHPNIVQLYRAKRLPDGRLALIMQHMAGPSLREVLQRDGALPWERAQQIMSDIAGALAFLHQRGIVHRDVKPENIYIEPEDGRALLADFGIAKSTDSNSVTVMGAVIGTPAYMSPEQVDGDAVDGRSDLYSLGLTAHEMLSGCKPWAGEGIYAIIYKQKNEALPALDGIRPALPFHLIRVVERCLAKDRNERWPSAREMLDHLDEAAPVELPGGSALAPAIPLDIQPQVADQFSELTEARVERRRRMPRGAAAVLLVCLIGAAALANAIPRQGASVGDGISIATDDVRLSSAPPGASAQTGALTTLAYNPADAPDSVPVAPANPSLFPQRDDAESASTVRALSGRIEQLERRLVARMDSARVAISSPATRSTSTNAAATPTVEPARRPTDQVPAVPDAPPAQSVQPTPASTVALVANEGPNTSLGMVEPAETRPLTPPQLLNRAAIGDLIRDAYPPALVRGRMAGTVVVRLLVDVNGRVTDRTVLESAGNTRFDQAALDVVGSMRFSPARLGGAPVARWVDMPLEFTPPATR